MTSIPVNQFVSLLGLRGQHYHTLSLTSVLEEAYEFSDHVWTNPRLYEFVDHGIEHSFRDIELTLGILAFLPAARKLTPLEKAVLGIASLFHDIGMQYSKYPRSGHVMANEEVRKQHVRLGSEMIREAVGQTFQKDRGGPLLPNEQMRRWLFDQASIVGFSHSGDMFFGSLGNRIHRERNEGNLQLYRPRLLAAAFRLGDEIHCAYTRISEFSRLDSPSIDPLTKAHWAACNYVSGVDVVAAGSGGIRINIRWRVPRGANAEERETVKRLLGDFRERRIREEAERVEKWLVAKEMGEPCLIKISFEPEPEEGDLATVPQDVKDYVQSYLASGGARPRSSQESPVQMLRSDDEMVSILASEANAFLFRDSSVLTQHTALRTGWHTNKYFRCRDLLSRKPFVDTLCQVLARQYRPLQLTDVLAVGTSGIRIGAQLSQILDLQFQYTFSRVAISSFFSSHATYTDYETEIAFDQGARIVLIDDILGVGSVVREVLEQLANPPGNPAQLLRVFCMYSLGDAKSALAGMSSVPIDALVSYPHVYYHEENKATGLCEICRANPEILRREDLS